MERLTKDRARQIANLTCIPPGIALNFMPALMRASYEPNLGWISVAMILDTSLVLWDVAGWHGGPLSPAAWCEILVCIAALLACVMMLRRSEAFAVAVREVW